MGKSTISMAIFNSYVSLPEGTPKISQFCGNPHGSQCALLDAEIPRPGPGQLSQGCDDRPGVLAGQLWNWNCLGDPK